MRKKQHHYKHVPSVVVKLVEIDISFDIKKWEMHNKDETKYQPKQSIQTENKNEAK